MSTRRNSARHSPQSPFTRVRDYDDLDAPWSPPKQNETRSRPTFRTGTLAGAYRATSYASMGDDDAPMGSAQSPRYTRQAIETRSPSDASNPPEELLDVYKRIEDDGTLANYVPSEGWEAPVDARLTGRLSRASSTTRRNPGLGFRDAFGSPEGSLLEANVAANSPRRRSSDYTRDEQRLKRVTGSHSPVFSKAKVGARAALTADNLQRREAEEQEEHVYEECDEGRGPSLNLPSTWGSRAARRQDWLRNVSGSSNEKKDEQAVPTNVAEPEKRVEEEPAPKPARSSPRSFERSNAPIRSALGPRTSNPPVLGTQAPIEEGTTGTDENHQLDEGAPIPNTPIVVYKNSTFSKPSPTKRDSQELLRKLSRTESPKLDQIQTPELPKLFERKIYDKTPRVTGAWIDTPMTEKVTELPKDLTKDIVPPSEPAPAPTENEMSTQQKDFAVAFAPPEPKLEKAKSDEGAAKNAPPATEPAKQSRPPLNRPKLPKSGLETVIEDVNSGKETLDLGDDTIESLRAIIEDPMELKSEEEEDDAYEKEVMEKLVLGEAKDQDALDLDRLNDKLQSLKRNIHEVKRGLNSLEEHVSPDAPPRPISPTKVERPTKPSHLHAGETCKTCNVYSDGRVYAAIPLPRLWTRSRRSRHFELTKLGWLTLVSLTWYVIECMMFERYSQPIMSDACNGYCVQPDAPDFPWVTVTMFWRWSHLSTILGPIVAVSVAFARLMAQLLGLWDGYVDEPPYLEKMMGEIRVNGTSMSFLGFRRLKIMALSQLRRRHHHRSSRSNLYGRRNLISRRLLLPGRVISHRWMRMNIFRDDF